MTPVEDLLARLERERLEADRLYNDALTAVDRAIQEAPDLPRPARHDDDRPVDLPWNILPDGPPPFDGSWKGRLRAFVWRLVGPPLEMQRRFNAELVDHVGRNAGAHRDARQVVSRLAEAVGREFEALVRFESLLVQYLQTITIYVDTKDRSAGGSELRDRLALAEQRILAIKRELEALPAADRPAGADSRAAANAFGGTVDSFTYVGFEDRFRGPQDDIRHRLEDYVPIFSSASNVLDVGCGRGEFLDLLRQHGVTARGVDTNDGMVRQCRERGLDVERADVLAYLEREPDGSLGGLAAIQVVEHFEPRYLLRFLEAASCKLRSGAPLVLETINPACWMAFFECYVRDITHRQALHPDTLQYLVRTSGFTSVDVQYRQPVTEGDRLERITEDLPGSPAPSGDLARVVSALNAHADKLNRRLFSSMDYAVIARRA